MGSSAFMGSQMGGGGGRHGGMNNNENCMGCMRDVQQLHVYGKVLKKQNAACLKGKMAMESDIRRQKEEYRDLKEKIKDLEKEKDKLRNSQKIGWFFFFM